MSNVHVNVEVHLLLAIAKEYCTVDSSVNGDTLTTLSYLEDIFSDTSSQITGLTVTLAIARIHLVQTYLRAANPSNPLIQAFDALISGLEGLWR